MSRAGELGRFGEDCAAAWYQAQGFVTLSRNWRPPSDHGRGELDLVCARGRLLVVVEVKTRTSDRFGSGLDAVGPAKRRRLRRLGSSWVATERSRLLPRGFDEIRFDVVDVNAQGHVRVHPGVC